jgi:ribosome-associated protein YbcJ (S4-like RNA binding protein)
MARYIELNDFLRTKNMAPTGGQIKRMIRSGDVKVNEVAETRNRKKLAIGDRVALGDKLFVVEEIDLREYPKKDKEIL